LVGWMTCHDDCMVRAQLACLGFGLGTAAAQANLLRLAQCRCSKGCLSGPKAPKPTHRTTAHRQSQLGTGGVARAHVCVAAQSLIGQAMRTVLRLRVCHGPCVGLRHALEVPVHHLTTCASVRVVPRASRYRSACSVHTACIHACCGQRPGQ